MKKVLAIIMAVIMTIGFAGCGGETENGETKVSFNTKPTIDETVLYDENGITITATDLTYDNFAATLHFAYCNSTDNDVYIAINSWGYGAYDRNFINGYQYDGISTGNWLDSGETLEENIDLYFDDLQSYGINEIADVELGFYIKRDDDTEEEVYLQIQTSIADSYDYTIDTLQESIKNSENTIYYTNEEFYNDYNVCIPFIALIEEDGEPKLLVEVENNSEYDVYASMYDFYFNQKEVFVNQGSWTSATTKGTKKYMYKLSLTPMMQYYEGDVYDILPLTSLEFTFNVGKDSKNSADTQTITITFPEPIEIPTDED